MRVRGKVVVVPLVLALTIIVGGAVFAGLYAWWTAHEWLPIPERSDVARMIAAAADEGHSEVQLPDEGGVWLLAQPYVLSESGIPGLVPVDSATAARIAEANMAPENMHLFHILDGECVGHCSLDARFDFPFGATVVPAGQVLTLRRVDEERPVLVEVKSGTAGAE